MSDTPTGPRWWLGVDGKWYPPEQWSGPLGSEPPLNGIVADDPTGDQRPRFADNAEAPPPPERPPGPGWWKASDGQWYPPEAHPSAAPPPPALSRPSAGSTGSSGSSSQRSARRKGAVVASIAVATVLLVAGAVVAIVATREPAPRTTAGPGAIGITFTLVDISDISGTVGDCFGTGGYDDFGSGMNVTVRDERGDLVGSAQMLSLESLKATQPEFYEQIEAGGSQDLSAEVDLTCEIATLVQIEDGSDIYEIEIGRRGDSSVTRAELDGKDWIVSLSLG
jgi:hypothetical protein